MTSFDTRVPDTESYRVFLLRLWRENNGPWHASLHAADGVAPRRFADLDALAEYLRAAGFVAAAPPAPEPEQDW